MTNPIAHSHPPIEVRRMDFEFSDDIPERWAPEGNAFLTALMSALSASFPAGERYFIDSVRYYAKQIDDDAALKERVRGFVGQEGMHTKEHVAFNRFLEGHGMPVAWIEKRVDRILRGMRKRLSPAHNLAHTVALEHLTAVLATAAMESPDYLGSMHPTLESFWGWHLVEELEHRSVAFDVYERCVGDDLLRMQAMATTTALFTVINLVRATRLLLRTGSFDAADVARGLVILFGREGLITKVWPLYFSFYRRDFHPDEHDNMAALEEAKQAYLKSWLQPRATA